MNRNIIFSLLAILFMAIGCQEGVEKIDLSKTHSVTIVASRDITRTSVEIDGSVAHYSWTTADADPEKFHIFENGEAALSVEPALNDGLMTIKATFDGAETPQSAEYSGYFNSGVASRQLSLGDSYDQNSDVLVAAKTTGNPGDGIMFQFKRLVSIGRMTLKGLDGTALKSVRIEATAGNTLSGEYDYSSTETPFNNVCPVINISTNNEIESGNATITFITLPVENANLKVTATTVNAKGNTLAVYEKTFAKGITFTEGDVRIFSVSSMTKSYEDPHADDDGWFLVKDVRALCDGDIIRIAESSKDAVAAAIGSGKFFTKVTGDFNDSDESLIAPDAINITLGRSGESWTMTTSEGLVGANTDLTLNKADATNEWQFAISDAGIATILVSGTEKNRILYNVNSPRFKTYTSSTTVSMLLPQVYKQYGTPSEDYVKQKPEVSFESSTVSHTLGSQDEFKAPEFKCTSDGTQTWTSTDESIATVDNEGNVTITATAAGSTTIKVSVAESDTYLAAEALYTITVVTAPVVGGDYILVTDVNDLSSGDKIVLGSVISDNTAYALGADNGNNRKVATVTVKSSSTITINSNVCPITLGGNTGAWTLNIEGEGYLYAAGGNSNNYLKVQSILSAPGYWSINVSEGKATIKTTDNTVARHTIRYNSSSNLISCYASGQGDIAIYKLDDGKQSQALSFDQSSIKAYTDDASLNKPTLSGAQTTVTYSSSNTSVATVNPSTGDIAIIGAGTTTISAEAVANDTYRAASASYEITVIASYASLSDLVNSGNPTSEGRAVRVYLTNELINSIYVSSNGNRVGVYVTAGGNNIELYKYGVPAGWGQGGLLTGCIEGDWQLFNNDVWEIVLASDFNWIDLSYTEPEKTLTNLTWTGYTASYTVGSQFSVNGTIKAVYDNGSEKVLTADDYILTVSPDFSAAGTTSATISYTEGGVTKTATATITVNAAVQDDDPIELTFDLSSNPGSWPTDNSTTLTNFTYSLNGTIYTFGLRNVKCNSGYLMLTSTAVLGLPAIEGKKLTKIEVKNSGGCSTSTKVGVSSSSASASYISGGAIQIWITTSSCYTYNLTNTTDGTVYYLYVTNKNAQIIELKLKYE